MAEATHQSSRRTVRTVHAYSAAVIEGAPNRCAIVDGEGRHLPRRRTQQVLGRISRRDAPPIHLVVTVCDAAARRTMPAVSGQAVEGALGRRRSATAAEFKQPTRPLRQRIERFIKLSGGDAGSCRLQRRATGIGPL